MVSKDEKPHVRKLKRLRACAEAVEFARGFDSMQGAWDACERGDWLLWFVGKGTRADGGLRHRKLVLVACQCARRGLKYVKAGEERPLKAIETAEAWANKAKGVTPADVRAAADAAYAAAFAAADAAYAAYAAADAAADVADAAYAAAAYAAYAAGNAAYVADVAAEAERKAMAKIVLKAFPKPPTMTNDD